MKAVLMHPIDNVATLLADANLGGTVAVTFTSGEVQNEAKANQHVPFGHKISIVDIEIGEKILKYGEVIGEATLPIKIGDHVHIHNMKSMTWGKFG